jgi:hypothetical protein
MPCWDDHGGSPAKTRDRRAIIRCNQPLSRGKGTISQGNQHFLSAKLQKSRADPAKIYGKQAATQGRRLKKTSLPFLLMAALDALRRASWALKISPEIQAEPAAADDTPGPWLPPLWEKPKG